MTIQEFINKYDGKSIDWDNAYGGQCVDLFRQYCNEVLGISQPRSVNGAADFWSNYDTDPVLNQNFTKLKNSAEFVPQSGDVAIWNRNMGKGFGHIAICTGKGDTNTFQSFDQNWSRVSYCELVTHSYTNFYGVLRFNKPLTENIYRGLDLTNTDSMKVCVDTWILQKEGKLVDTALYESIKGQLTETQKQNTILSSELGVANSQIKTLLDKTESQAGIIKDLNDKDVAELKTLKGADERATNAENIAWEVIRLIGDDLKVSTANLSLEDAISAVKTQYTAFSSSSNLANDKIKSLEDEVKRLNTYKRPIAKISTKDLILYLLKKLIGKV